jgi:hypothetical protein
MFFYFSILSKRTFWTTSDDSLLVSGLKNGNHKKGRNIIEEAYERSSPSKSESLCNWTAHLPLGKHL